MNTEKLQIKFYIVYKLIKLYRLWVLVNFGVCGLIYLFASYNSQESNEYTH